MEMNLKKLNLFTEREKTLMKYIAEGLKDPVISKKLGISMSYIRTDLINKMIDKAKIFNNNVSNRASLIYWAVKNGVIS